MDVATFREKLARLGCPQPLSVEWAVGYSRPLHAHGFAAHGLVLRGSFTLTTFRGSRLLSEGDAFELAAGIAHSEDVGPQGAQLLVAALPK